MTATTIAIHDHGRGIVENGLVLSGRSVGAAGEATGDLVFNTAMSGYQEILTDPSYAGQTVIMTYPQIGNYGVADEDNESSRTWAEAFVMRHMENMSIGEISKRTDRSSDAIRSSLYRVKRLMIDAAGDGAPGQTAQPGQPL